MLKHDLITRLGRIAAARSRKAASWQNAAARRAAATAAFAWFDEMIEHCHEYATAAKAAGRPVVGILCEYTPRELIMAAGGVPVCLCGGSAKTIPAAEQHLPANLCPLIKSTYGYHVLQQQSVPGDGRPGGGRDHLRRQEEDVRVDGRDAADVRARTAAEAGRRRRPGLLGAGVGGVPRLSSQAGLPADVTDDNLREAIAADEPRAGLAAASWRR